MCGLVGYLGSGDRDILEAMARSLRHRGPDEEGCFIEGDVGMAYRRLSILDPERGRQPLFSEDGQIVVVCNGELYNHLELRRELQCRGHRFATNSDAEVLVHLYEELGPGLVGHLEGMFALALWDRSRRRLVLGRDRMGIKPLHYWTDGARVVFGSEIRALLAHPRVPGSLDRCALDQYLTFDYVPAPRTLFLEIRKLPAAHTLVCEVGTIRLERYWQPRIQPERGVPEAEWEERFLGELRASVRRHMMADVPLGAFLSGGLDSSTLVALMAECGPVRTFSVAFQEESFDESGPARQVAALFGTEHHEEVFTAERCLELLPHLPQVLDEPLADPSVLPTWFLSRMTRPHVKVALSGEGGDELLAGYPTYPAAHLAEALRRLPRPLLRALRNLVERLPVSTRNWSLDFRLKRFLKYLEEAPGPRQVLWAGSFSPAEKAGLYGPGMQGRWETFAPLDGLPREGLDLTSGLLLQDLTLYLADDLLTKLDRASMACSLEARVPFLHAPLVELAARIPPDLKLRGLTGKRLLKRATRRLVPRAIRRRPKKGFGIPLGEWLKGPLRPWLLDLLGDVGREDLFRPQAVERLVDQHMRGQADHRKLLWTLAVFLQWRRAWCPSGP